MLYYPEKENNNFINKINYPGEFPYTRGIHSNMYRGKVWTMRQFSGFGAPIETNERFKFLLKNLDAIPSLAPISIIFILSLKFNNLTPSKSSSNIFVNLIKDLDIKYKSGWLLIIFSKKYSIPDCVFE